MKTLDDLLEIADAEERKRALFKYARRLNVSPAKLKSLEAAYDEQSLVVSVFDAERTYFVKRSQNRNFTIVGGVVAVLIGILIAMLPQWMNSAYEEASVRSSRKYVDTETGSIISQKAKQKEYAVVMNGVYEERNTAGVLTAEYLYKDGILTQKKVYNSQGQITAVEKY